jgi:hypothetical protein
MLHSPPSELKFETSTSSVPQIEKEVDVRYLLLKLRRGLHQTLGLVFIGIASVGTGVWLIRQSQPVTTSTRVVISFPGSDRGEYPDKSAFQADDIRAPAIISESLRRQGLDVSSDFQSTVRGALSIEGVFSPTLLRERERARANGIAPARYVPDEYTISLSLPPNISFPSEQRARLLNEIVSVYRENFRRTYGQPPIASGTAFETLKHADFPEYELVLNTELDNIRAYLKEQVELAKSFRSPTTNMSFKDLLEQTDLFAQIQVNEALGFIHQNGLSRNRATALMKMDYYLRTLEDRENRLIEEEKVVRDLLSQTQTRTQSYVLGIRSQAAQSRGEAPVVDQGLIDSLLANDSYNFLVRRALEAGLQVKAVQADKARLVGLRENMKSLTEKNSADQAAVTAEAQKALTALETSYQALIANIRNTHADFAQQQFGNAIRLSDQIRTEGFLKPIATGSAVGGFLGMALGVGLSLLGIYITRDRRVQLP